MALTTAIAFGHAKIFHFHFSKVSTHILCTRKGHDVIPILLIRVKDKCPIQDKRDSDHGESCSTVCCEI